jgi:O-antigen ligase/polysaccharide polymerase Wzy-like membrane protein
MPTADRAPTSTTDRASTLLGAGLLVLCGYAAFADGAISTSAGAHLQIAIAIAAALAAAAWLWTGKLRLSADRPARIGVGLLTAFAAWSAVTVLWSATPDRTWLEFNRVGTYVLVVLLAIAFGASSRKAIAFTARGMLILVGLVIAYALGQKVLPGVNLGGLIDLNQTAHYARLQQPLGYWNALALLLALAAPPAIALAARVQADARVRTAALVLLQLLIVTVGFTESRGGIVALIVAIAAGVWLSGRALQHLAWAAVAITAALPPLVVALSSHALTTDGVGLGAREHAGLLLLAVLAASATVLVLGAGKLFELEPTITLSPERQRRLWRLVAAVVVAVVVLAVLHEVVSQGGIGAALNHLKQKFASPQQVSVSNPNRLFSTDSADRIGWWRQALGAFSQRPFGGWGAGSFPVINLLFRHDQLTAADVHSVPLQWLAETGLIGLALAVSAWLLCLKTAVGAVRRNVGEHRWAAAALLAAILAYSLHCLYDWDWDIPGVTLPVLVALGVLIGAFAAPQHQAFRPHAILTPARKLVGLTAIVAGLCVIATSALLPSIAASKASNALLAAANGTPASVIHAAGDAQAAVRIDPLSDAGLTASASIAEQLDELQIARGDLLEALNREPDDISAWSSLLGLDAAFRDWVPTVNAAERLLELNPEMYGTQLANVLDAARAATLAEAPPEDSATSQP